MKAPTIPSCSFPRGFKWGVAAAAPQIEGAARKDGKGESVWDHFARQPGRITGNANLDVACDHYHRFASDFALMRDLGVRRYRLSLAWPRILPNGDGAVNQAGIDFYHRLLDAMEAAEIEPWITMFHWDLPQALESRYGGWRSRRTVDAFARYADVIVQAYGRRVKHWITLNEMSSFTVLAHGVGERPPGIKSGEEVVNLTYHHALMAHGHGVRAVREYGGRGARVGLTDDAAIPVPIMESPPHIAAAQKAFRELNYRSLDPLFHGRFTSVYRRLAGPNAVRAQRGDFNLISMPTDFLGLNVYTGVYVRAGRGGRPEYLDFPASFPTADASWLRLVPQAMYWGPRLAQSVYGADEIYITENGAGYDDVPNADGEIVDLHRRQYIRQCLGELHRCIQHGVPVKGYFCWSFMDNFEWLDGYTKRFGLCYTDYATQRRIPKLSANWYAEIMRTNSLV